MVAVVSFIPRCFSGGQLLYREIEPKGNGNKPHKNVPDFQKKFFCKQKSRHIDSTNSGETFHPLAQFALKLCNGLTLNSDCPYVTNRVSDYTFFGQIICVGIKPMNK